jgi:hypothetical protein
MRRRATRWSGCEGVLKCKGSAKAYAAAEEDASIATEDNALERVRGFCNIFSNERAVAAALCACSVVGES